MTDAPRVVELRLESGRILFYRNNNPEKKPEYGFWIDCNGRNWYVEMKDMQITAIPTGLVFKDEMRE